MDLFWLALKNVLRNRRRSILNIIALTVGLCIMILGLGWVNGYHTYIYGSLIRLDTGHAQYLAEGYLAEERRLPVDLLLDNYSAILSALEVDPRVEAVSGRVDFPVKLAAPGESVRLLARAVDPAGEAGLSTVKDFIEDGRYLDAGPGLLIGRPLAEALGLSPGDTVFVSARDRHGVENLVDLAIVGVFHLGYPAMDKYLAFMDLNSASFLLDLNDQVNRVVVRLLPGIDPGRFLAGTPVLPAKGEWQPWQRFARTAVAAVEADSGGFTAMIVIMYLLIVLGILNSMSMSVHERTREIGTLRAIGIRRSRLVRLFMLEALWLALPSVIAALILSIPGIYFLQFVGIDLAGALPADLPVPFGERFRADFQAWHFILGAVLTLVSALLGAWLPARRGSKIIVAEALRTTVV
jgi:putative ABC transport system permease protein